MNALVASSRLLTVCINFVSSSLEGSSCLRRGLLGMVVDVVVEVLEFRFKRRLSGLLSLLVSVEELALM